MQSWIWLNEWHVVRGVVIILRQINSSRDWLQSSVDLIGVDVLVDVAECRVVGIAPSRAATGREAALVDFVSFDVTWRVVAGEKASFVIIRVSGEGATDSRRPIVSHLRKVANVVTVSWEISKLSSKLCRKVQ